jgi:Flp pilus assembly protein TadG
VTPLMVLLMQLRLCCAVRHRLQYIAQMLAETAALHKQTAEAMKAAVSQQERVMQSHCKRLHVSNIHTETSGLAQHTAQNNTVPVLSISTPIRWGTTAGCLDLLLSISRSASAPGNALDQVVLLLSFRPTCKVVPRCWTPRRLRSSNNKHVLKRIYPAGSFCML